ncbi:ribose-phosphate pyrophosphokinase-like domain-containing protein [Patescibacteria group bacterium]|nr:ribose-phosphate pyrophosphokinase-like domain-containing protein [Patescibacteria group bacterium]
MRRRILLHCQNMTGVARALVAHSNQQRRATAVGCEPDPLIELGVIKWGRFRDGYPDILIDSLDHMIGADVVFLAAFDKPEVIFEQMSVIYALAEFCPHSFKILLPYFPTGTMERVDTEGQVATAATLAQMLSAVAPAGHGPVPLYIWDIHTLQNRHYFGPNITPRFKTGMHLLQNLIRSLPEVAICFPDYGAWNRFKVMFTRRDPQTYWDFIICRKARDPNDKDRRMVVIEEGDPRNKHVIMIDDLIHTGFTLIECGKVMRAAGAASVSLFATHGVMENESWKRFLDAGFEHVWITDSCPMTAQEVAGRDPLEVISLVPSIYDAIFDR